MTRPWWVVAAAVLAALVLDWNPVDHGAEIADVFRRMPPAGGGALLLALLGLGWALRGPRSARRLGFPRRRERTVAEAARRRGMTRDAVRLARARAGGAADPSARHDSPPVSRAPAEGAARERPSATLLPGFPALLLPAARSLRKAEP